MAVLAPLRLEYVLAFLGAILLIYRGSAVNSTVWHLNRVSAVLQDSKP